MSRLFGFTLACAGLCLSAVPSPGAPVPAAKRPQIEVVFCLDTTGSMGGLIDGAKAKIWSLCNQIAGGKPTPDLKVGLVAYKDRGDAYVTRVVDLTADLDAVHGELKKLEASGGGDGPESVNQALDDAVNKIKWGAEKKALRIVFLVGDAPPHMDYADDVKYPVTCKKAAERGIILNTIQCGNDPETTKIWKDIAGKAEGSFVAIPQDGGVVAIATPFDKDLAELNTKLTRTAVVFGGLGVRREALRKLDEAAKLPAAPAADRAGFAGKSGKGAGEDLVDAIKDGKVRLSEVKEADLPDELKKLGTEAERKAFVEARSKERDELNKKAAELDRKRSEYIRQEMAKKKDKGRDSFDSQVLEVLRKQAKRFEIDY